MELASGHQLVGSMMEVWCVGSDIYIRVHTDTLGAGWSQGWEEKEEASWRIPGAGSSRAPCCKVLENSKLKPDLLCCIQGVFVKEARTYFI